MLEFKETSIQEIHLPKKPEQEKLFTKPKIMDLDWEGWPFLRVACGIAAVGMFVSSGISGIKRYPGETTYIYEVYAAIPTPRATPTTLPKIPQIPFEDAVRITHINGTPVPRPPKEEVVFDNGKTQIIITTYPK